MSVFRFANRDTFKNSDNAKDIQMGCFLTCFGFEKSRKRRKPAKRSSPSGEQQECHGRYELLDSEIPVESGPSLSSSSSLKIKKKVRFNLNVKTYEPIPDEDDDDFQEETPWEFDSETNFCHQEKDQSIGSSIQTQSSAANRYQNCRNNYEDEDEDEDEELMFDDEDLNFSDSEDEANASESDDEIPDKENLNIVDRTLDHSVSAGSLSSQIHARDGGKYVFNVLNPVENLIQWKAVKSKGAIQQFKHCVEKPKTKQEGQGENLSSLEGLLAFKKMGSPRASRSAGCTIAVDVSLSNWLGSAETQISTKNSSLG